VNGVDAAGLSDPFDTTDSLFETKRRPWQLEVDHQPATLLKVEPFAGGIRGEEKPCIAPGESAQILATLSRRQTTVQRYRLLRL
jgi:hypothetical protein